MTSTLYLSNYVESGYIGNQNLTTHNCSNNPPAYRHNSGLNGCSENKLVIVFMCLLNISNSQAAGWYSGDLEISSKIALP